MEDEHPREGHDEETEEGRGAYMPSLGYRTGSVAPAIMLLSFGVLRIPDGARKARLRPQLETLLGGLGC